MLRMSVNKYVIFLIFCSVITCNVMAANKESVIYINTIKAQLYNKNSYDISTRDNSKITSKNGILYKSDSPNLTATVFYKSGKSFIEVNFNGFVKRLEVNGDIGFIKWRPRNNAFFYSKILEFQGGDFGECALHYVTLKLDGKLLKTSDLTISKKQPDTDLAWSNDGNYYAFSEFSSLKIKEFKSGKLWVAKSIIINGGSEKIIIMENNPIELGGFYWEDKDNNILFYWRDKPDDDAPSGYAKISVKEFFEK